MYEFWKNGIEMSYYAKEVTGDSTIKVSLTWEIKSGDIANSAITNNNDLFNKLKNMVHSKFQTEILFNFEEIEGKDLIGKEFIEGIKEFMKDHPDGIKEFMKDDYKGAENKENADGFPIKVEIIWEKNIEDLEIVYPFYGISNLPYEQFNIEADGKVVDVNELMSMVNEYHGLDDWSCIYPALEVDYMPSI